MEKEIWKKIPNYEKYLVSNLGRVKSLVYNKERIMKYKGHNKVTGNRVSLWNEKGNKDFLVARLVAFTFYNQDINNHNLTVDHLDGNRFNNNLNNLELVSLKENIRRGFENNLYSCQIKVKIINKNTNYDKTYRSLSQASVAIGHNKGYISGMIKLGKYENKNFKWVIK